MKRHDKIYIAGHKGLVGSALFKTLKERGYENIIYRNHRHLDLTDQAQVDTFFREKTPDYVFMSAGLVGGIHGNSQRQGDFLYQNAQMALNVIESARKYNVKKLLYLGSSCIYPKDTEIPIKESQLLSGKLEETNEGYAVAKILGIELCKMYRRQYDCNFISAMPCNLYGPNDRYDELNGHFIPSMIMKVVKAKKEGTPITIWGSGNPIREFLYSEDLADALLYLMDNYSGEGHINVGTGIGISVWNATLEICNAVGYNGSIVFDNQKPDGTYEKTMDVSTLYNMGWHYKTDFEDGIRKTVEDYERKI